MFGIILVLEGYTIMIITTHFHTTLCIVTMTTFLTPMGIFLVCGGDNHGNGIIFLMETWVASINKLCYMSNIGPTAVQGVLVLPGK